MSDWFDDGGTNALCDVVALFDSKAGQLVFDVVAGGALVSLYLTRDGGAVGITVTCDGRSKRNWFRDADAAADWLLGAADAVAGRVRPVTPISPPARPRKAPRAR